MAMCVTQMAVVSHNSGPPCTLGITIKWGGRGGSITFGKHKLQFNLGIVCVCGVQVPLALGVQHWPPLEFSH